MSVVGQENDGLLKETQTDTEIVSCPNCGANMVFDPESQSLKCAYCRSIVSFDTENAEEIDFNSGITSDREWTADEAVVFCCDNCGAKVVLAKGETTKFCPFCGTAHVQKTEELPGLKPNGVVPFAFSKDKAIEYSKAWAKKRFFAPRKFKKNICTDSVNGVYTPTFTFDSNTVSFYQGRIGRTHTRTVGSGKNRRVQTYVVWRNISGRYDNQYDDVLVTAGTKFGQKELDKVSPYDTNASKEYDENFLFGFMAYHYDIEISDCWNSAKGRMDKSIRRGILSRYSYDRLAYLNVSTTHDNVKYKYVMLPVYVGNYRFKDKLFNFFVNGKTGKVAGKTPKSWLKILLTALFGVALVVGIYLLSQL